MLDLKKSTMAMIMLMTEIDNSLCKCNESRAPLTVELPMETGGSITLMVNIGEIMAVENVVSIFKNGKEREAI